MALIVLCFAAAGSRVSVSGGLYAYIDVAFGGYIGFIGGVLYWLTACFSVASVANALTGSMGALGLPGGSGISRAVVLVALFGILAVINVRGVRLGARLVELVTVTKLLPLLLLIVVGVWFIEPAALSTGVPPLSEVGATSILLIFAFVGIEVALVPSGEIKDPARTVPRAALAALAITTAIYLVVQAVAQGVLGSALASYADAPLAETAGRVLGSAGRLLVLIGGTVSMFGYVSGDMLGTPRALFALGRDRVLPAALARVHPRFHTPATAIVTYAVVVAALAVNGSFAQLAILANVAALSLYLLCVAASWELQRRDLRMAGTPFTMPGGPLVPVLAAAGIIWLLAQATRREFQIEGIMLLAGTAFYVVRRALSGWMSPQSA
jgi:amino acid transporter